MGLFIVVHKEKVANFSFLSEDGDDDVCNDDDDDVPNRAAQKGVVVGACIERLFLALGHSYNRSPIAAHRAVMLW